MMTKIFNYLDHLVQVRLAHALLALVMACRGSPSSPATR